MHHFTRGISTLHTLHQSIAVCANAGCTRHGCGIISLEREFQRGEGQELSGSDSDDEFLTMAERRRLQAEDMLPLSQIRPLTEAARVEQTNTATRRAHTVAAPLALAAGGGGGGA